VPKKPLLGQRNRIHERSHRRLAVAVLARMRPLVVIMQQPCVQVKPDLFDASVHLPVERNRVELVVCGDCAFVLVCAMSSSSRYGAYSWCSRFPQYSLPLSVSTRRSGIPCESKNGITSGLSASAATSASFLSYSLQNATFV